MAEPAEIAREVWKIRDAEKENNKKAAEYGLMALRTATLTNSGALAGFVALLNANDGWISTYHATSGDDFYDLWTWNRLFDHRVRSRLW